jgi:hypothetical protein
MVGRCSNEEGEKENSGGGEGSCVSSGCGGKRRGEEIVVQLKSRGGKEKWSLFEKMTLSSLGFSRMGT